jgi:hypothetical protein
LKEQLSGGLLRLLNTCNDVSVEPSISEGALVAFDQGAAETELWRTAPEAKLKCWFQSGED